MSFWPIWLVSNQMKRHKAICNNGQNITCICFVNQDAAITGVSRASKTWLLDPFAASTLSSASALMITQLSWSLGRCKCGSRQPNSGRKHIHRHGPVTVVSRRQNCKSNVDCCRDHWFTSTIYRTFKVNGRAKTSPTLLSSCQVWVLCFAVIHPAWAQWLPDSLIMFIGLCWVLWYGCAVCTLCPSRCSSSSWPTWSGSFRRLCNSDSGSLVQGI